MTEPVAHENFDPYHKWLGISPKDQPPHHYRLLAIDLFESDPDVISAAADKQMAFIRSFQTGKNAQFSHKILNEIAAARVCLLNVPKKAFYDGTLRARIAAAGALPAPRRAEPLPVTAVVPVDDAILVVAEPADPDFHGSLPLQLDGSARSQIRKKKSKRATILPLVAVGAMLAICAVAIAVVMSRTPETHVSRADANPNGNPRKDAELPDVTPATQGNKPQVPADPVQPTPPKSPLRPVESSDKDAKNKLFRENQPKVKSVHVPQSETPAKPTEAEKPKTPEELDKQLADAKTPEDYKAVAGEALRSASKAMDASQQVEAKKLLLKALIAARKSRDFKLIVKVTRTLAEPESAKEILAEKDN
ncbi:MAG: hypothetical protein ABSG53_11000 [Thermoguttaceae bacterium]|jgi:hypothetical protein